MNNSTETILNENIAALDRHIARQQSIAYQVTEGIRRARVQMETLQMVLNQLMKTRRDAERMAGKQSDNVVAEWEN